MLKLQIFFLFSTAEIKRKDEMKRIIVAVLLLCCWGASVAFSQNELRKELEAVIRDKKARVGVAVIYDGKDTLTLNNEYRYPMMSVFKFHQALSVLNDLDSEGLPLDTEIFVKKSDLHPNTYSPLRDSLPQGNFNMTVAELLRYSITLSDNNACDILFEHFGGTDRTEKYMKGLGIEKVVIRSDENEMHTSVDAERANWTTPLEAARVMDIFLRNKLFSTSLSDFLENLLICTSTGTDKIKGGLPSGVIMGHKTGSSSRTARGIKIADNDLAFVQLPDGKRYTIAVFVMDADEDDKTIAGIISRISRHVYDFYTRTK